MSDMAHGITLFIIEMDFDLARPCLLFLSIKLQKKSPSFWVLILKELRRRRRRKREKREKAMEAARREKAIEHEIGGLQNDTLRFGLHSVKSEIVGSHPLQSAYQSTKEVQEQMKRRILVNTYGSAFPLKMDLDQQMLSRFQRPPGPIPSSMLGLEALTGGLEDFGFEDYLNATHVSLKHSAPWTCITEWKLILDSPRDRPAPVSSEELCCACQRKF
ncbi:unnamed protein product [Camellia sinensis]